MQSNLEVICEIRKLFPAPSPARVKALRATRPPKHRVVAPPFYATRRVERSDLCGPPQRMLDQVMSQISLLLAQRKLFKSHHLPQLFVQAQLGIGHAALPTAKCRICRFHIDADFLAKFHWTGQIK